jgi:hypothetical protein
LVQELGYSRSLVGAVAVAILLLTLTNPTNVYAATLSPSRVIQGSGTPVIVTGTTSVLTLVFVQVRTCAMPTPYTTQIGPLDGPYSVNIPTNGLGPGTYSVEVAEPGDSAVFTLSFTVISPG